MKQLTVRNTICIQTLIVLTDILAKDAEGEAMDLNDALAVAPSYVKIKNGTYKGKTFETTNTYLESLVYDDKIENHNELFVDYLCVKNS